MFGSCLSGVPSEQIRVHPNPVPACIPHSIPSHLFTHSFRSDPRTNFPAWVLLFLCYVRKCTSHDQEYRR